MDIESVKVKATHSSETIRLTSRKTKCNVSEDLLKILKTQVIFNWELKII